jgi:hypothetical protein
LLIDKSACDLKPKSFRQVGRNLFVTKGFGYHDGARKYLEGLKSSDINKKQKAVRSAVEWLIRR